MRLLTNRNSQPLLQTKTGEVINLNSLETLAYTKDMFPIKDRKGPRMSNHRNEDFLTKAGRVFKVSRLFKMQNSTTYMLAAHIKLFCVVEKDNIWLIGNYPLHYLKLLYRYVNSLIVPGSVG